MRYEYHAVLVEKPAYNNLDTLGNAGWEAYAVTWDASEGQWWVWLRRLVTP